MSLMLDMSSLGSVEPIQPVCTPRDITLQFLRTSSRVLSKEELQQRAQSLAQLQEEFSVRYPQPLALLARGCSRWGGGRWSLGAFPWEMKAPSPAAPGAGDVGGQGVGDTVPSSSLSMGCL